MLRDFRVTVTISAPVHEVWNKLVDWQSQGDWMALTRVTASSQGAADSNVGTTIDAFTGIGKLGILDRMRVTTWQPPTFCAVEHYGAIIKGIGEFNLSELPDSRTRFDWFERIEAPTLILALIKPGVLIAVYYSLRKFAATFPAKRS